MKRDVVVFEARAGRFGIRRSGGGRRALQWAAATHQRREGEPDEEGEEERHPREVEGAAGDGSEARQGYMRRSLDLKWHLQWRCASRSGCYRITGRWHEVILYSVARLPSFASYPTSNFSWEGGGGQRA